MPKFLYKAINKEGENVTGKIDAQNEGAAKYMLEDSQGLSSIELDETAKESPFSIMNSQDSINKLKKHGWELSSNNYYTWLGYYKVIKYNSNDTRLKLIVGREFELDKLKHNNPNNWRNEVNNVNKKQPLLILDKSYISLAGDDNAFVGGILFYDEGKEIEFYAPLKEWSNKLKSILVSNRINFINNKYERSNMPSFTYHAINQQGEKIIETIESESVEVASNLLKEQGLILIKIEDSLNISVQDSTLSHNENTMCVTNAELLLFTKQFKTMLEEGAAIVTILQTMEKNYVNKKLKNICANMEREILDGARLYEAFRKYPEVFHELFCIIVKYGEDNDDIFVAFETLIVIIENGCIQ